MDIKDAINCEAVFQIFGGQFSCAGCKFYNPHDTNWSHFKCKQEAFKVIREKVGN